MERLVLTIEDTLGFWDDHVGDYVFNSTRAQRASLVVQGVSGTLAPAQLDALFRYWYGDRWQLGNDDGTKYVVLGVTQRPAAADEVLAGLQHVIFDPAGKVCPAV